MDDEFTHNLQTICIGNAAAARVTARYDFFVIFLLSLERERDTPYQCRVVSVKTEGYLLVMKETETRNKQRLSCFYLISRASDHKSIMNRAPMAPAIKCDVE